MSQKAYLILKFQESTKEILASSIKHQDITLAWKQYDDALEEFFNSAVVDEIGYVN